MQTEEIKKGWKKVKLGDLYKEKVNSGLWKSSQYMGKGYKLIKMNQLFGFDFIDSRYNGYDLIELNENEIINKTVKKGDLLFSRTSVKASGVGKHSLVIDDSHFLSYDSNTIRVRLNNNLAHPNFYYYYFKSYLGNNSITSIASGSNVAVIKSSELGNIIIPFPPFQTQQKIASILGKYDDLIENNNKRIKTLEQIAQTIYHQWFVKFQFPGCENSKFVDSQTDFGKIPEGWEVKSVLDIDYIKFIRENIKNLEGKKIYYATADIDGISITGKGVVINSKTKPSRAQKQPIENSVWFARMQETFKVLGFTKQNKDIAENIVLSSGMVGFKTEDLVFPYLYFTINSKDFHKIKDLYCTGSTQKALTNDGLKQIKVIQADIEIVKKYGKIVLPILDEIFNLQKQNQNLKQTRDMLIPKLVAGKIDVDDLDVI